MRILAVNWLDPANPQSGGAEVHLFEILRRLVTRGHDVTVVCSGFGDVRSQTSDRRRQTSEGSRSEGIAIHRVGGRHSFALKGRGAVRRQLAAGTYDIVVEDINKLPLYLPTLTALPVYVIVPHLFGSTVFREASLPVAAIVWLAERRIPRVYRRAQFQAISDSTRDDLVTRGVPSERVRVIYPGVDAAWYSPPSDPPVSRSVGPSFLYLGRLRRYKGVDTAIRAVALARERGTAVRLVIAGTGDDRSRLARIARRLDVTSSVHFAGFVTDDEKRRLMRDAWAVVLPSAKEGWGLTNIEAAACGTPALAADRPGLRETVRHGETGYLFPYGDAAGLAGHFHALAGDAALVERLGRAARAFAGSFAWEAAATQTEAHLLETLEHTQPRRRD